MNPYSALPDHHFWRRSIAGVEPFLLDPVVSTRFTILQADKVATAGSCFAQHISRRLATIGFNYFIAEEGGEIPPEQRQSLGYGVFSARFGNIYTTRQLLQLFEESFDARRPIEEAWTTPDGRWVDALRPRITPGGYASREAVAEERQQHVGFVRRMFEECDVFVFTLGLTEAWQSRIDGTVYPLAPGVAGGSFDPQRHEFVNFGIADVVADLDTFLERLKLVNPRVKVVLTVSPVPLIATFEPRNVLVSTTYSKSVLRVAAEEAYRKHPWVEYFPSYEIITGNFNDSTYYEDDYRSINQLGVDHAMRCFLKHYAGASGPAQAQPVAVGVDPGSDLQCDEEAIDEIRT